MKKHNNDGSGRSRFTAYDIARIGMMIAVLEVVKRILDSIPNVELVSFFIIIFTIYYGWKTMIAVYAFVGIEFLFWGFGIWSICYLYVWAILVALIMLARKKDSYILYCIISGVYGLAFGALCAITTIFIMGPAGALGWWIAGIPFDLIHGVSNFLVCLALFIPVRKVMEVVTRWEP